MQVRRRRGAQLGAWARPSPEEDRATSRRGACGQPVRRRLRKTRRASAPKTRRCSTRALADTGGRAPAAPGADPNRFAERAGRGPPLASGAVGGTLAPAPGTLLTGVRSAWARRLGV
eukprot:13795161-Alexandrium_andersonii.AAC.1